MRNPNCERCPLHLSSKTVCVWGDGPEDAEIMVIGEAPGKAEAKTGKPFQGDSGQLLRQTLKEYGLEGKVYITNVAKCRPPENRTPTNDELAACRMYLDEEIATVKPKYVVTLGNTPSLAVLGKNKITKCHGEIVEKPDFIGIPMYHPAYTLYDASKLPDFKADVRKLADLVSGVQRYTPPDWKVINHDTIDQFIEEFQAAEEFAFDTETSGLFPYNRLGHIQCLSLAIAERAWVLPLVRHDTPFFNHRVRQDIVDIIADLAEGKFAIAQNGKFDNQWLEIYFGRRFHLNFDTMLASHLLNENRYHDLKSLSRNILGAPDYDLPLKEKLGAVKSRKLYKYAAYDAWNTFHLYPVFDRELRKDKYLRQLYYKMIMPASRLFEDVEMMGMIVDLDQMKVIEAETEANIERLLKKLNKHVNREVNWNSPPQVAQVLFKDLGLNPVAMTDGGEPSTAEATLIELRDQHPVADLLVKYREQAKFLSTYIHGWRGHMNHATLHLGYKLHGTVTGRYSSRLHQTPRDTRIRSLITNRGEWPFVQIDISQAEMRVACILSGDLELRRCFTEGIDVHWRTLLHTVLSGGSGEYVDPVLDTARKLNGAKLQLADAAEFLLGVGPERCIETWGGWKEARKKAKGINFGFLFGMFEKKFIQYCKEKYGFEPTMEEARRYRKAFFSLYYGLEPWHKKQGRLVRANGQIRNLAGRIRRLPDIHSKEWGKQNEAVRQAINSPVQGFVGDYKAMAMVEIHEEVPHTKFRLAGEHHDAILGYVNPYKRDDILHRVASIMRHPKLLDTFGISLSIPMEVEVSVGPWGKGVTVKV